jgi:hypothetical protein
MKVAFLIGSPRSGTTILENILNCHERIAEFYEPYYLWENFFSAATSDVWDKKDLTPDIIRQIRQEFAIFARKSKKPIVLDKSPAHAYNIPLILNVFPQAKWIHIVRDGRDVTLSIGKEWEKRKNLVEQKDFLSLFKAVGQMLARQPIFRFKLMAIIHELKQTLSLNPYQYLNKSRWKGKVGWGPRFSGWETYLNTHSVLEFNAMQWATSVKAAGVNWGLIDENNRLEVRYEALLTDPQKTISSILTFLGCSPSKAFFSVLPSLIPGNFNKWEKEFSGAQLAHIFPVLLPMLKHYKYLTDHESQ